MGYGTVLQLGTNTTKVLGKCLRRVARARNRKVKFIADSARMLAEDVRATPRSIRKGIRRRTQAYRRAEAISAAVIKNLYYNAAHTILKEWNTVVLPTTSSHHWCKGRQLHSSVKLRAQMLRFGALLSDWSRRPASTLAPESFAFPSLILASSVADVGC